MREINSSAQAMRQAGQGGDELLQLAAKADAAQLKLEAAASKAASAAEAPEGFIFLSAGNGAGRKIRRG